MKVAKRIARYFIIFLSGLSLSNHVFSFPIVKTGSSNGVAKGYNNCSFSGSYANATISFLKPVPGALANILIRYVIVYVYGENGKLIPDGYRYINSFSMNNSRGITGYEDGHGGFIYQGTTSGDPWNTINPFSANVVLSFSPAVRAVAVLAATWTDRGNVMPPQGIISVTPVGAAYLSPETNGTCKLIRDPSTPPSAQITLNVDAPDWDLGNLPNGTNDTRFTQLSQQLCFAYNPYDPAVDKEKFVVNASNSNGVTGGQYKLQNLADATQIVPYTLALDSGVGTPLTLPNNNSAISLSDTGKTCFSPTFTTTVDKNVKPGDYRDVLNFTVTTKP